MGDFNFKAKDKIVHYYIDDKNKAHILFRQNKGYVDIKTFEHVEAAKDAVSKREYVCENNQTFEILSGIPMPNYNDGFGANGYRLDPSILESVKLHRYQRCFTKFYAGKGINMDTLINAVDLRNDLYRSRIIKQVKFATEVEKAQKKIEEEKKESASRRELLEKYMDETFSNEEKIR